MEKPKLKLKTTTTSTLKTTTNSQENVQVQNLTLKTILSVGNKKKKSEKRRETSFQSYQPPKTSNQQANLSQVHHF